MGRPKGVFGIAALGFNRVRHPTNRKIFIAEVIYCLAGEQFPARHQRQSKDSLRAGAWDLCPFFSS